MAAEDVKRYLLAHLPAERIMSPGPGATVEEAAASLGVPPERIAKTLALRGPEGPLLVVTAGNTRLDNRQFRDRFGLKPRMLSGQEALEQTGHPPGGVCPFMLPTGATVCLDASLKDSPTVFVAAGDTHLVVEMTPEELARLTGVPQWDSLCRPVPEKGDAPC